MIGFNNIFSSVGPVYFPTEILFTSSFGVAVRRSGILTGSGFEPELPVFGAKGAFPSLLAEKRSDMTSGPFRATRAACFSLSVKKIGTGCFG
jgi:hypothetical protein